MLGQYEGSQFLWSVWKAAEHVQRSFASVRGSTEIRGRIGIGMMIVGGTYNSLELACGLVGDMSCGIRLSAGFGVC